MNTRSDLTEETGVAAAADGCAPEVDEAVKPVERGDQSQEGLRLWYAWGRSAAARRWIRRLRWNQGWDEPVLTTTRQVGAISPLLVRQRQKSYGPALGRDLLTSQAVYGHPADLYREDFVSSPNVCVLGGIGTGKSTLVKSFYLLRALSCGHRVAVFDRKRQWQDGSYGGEYLRVAREMHGTVLRFSQDRAVGTCLNVLDPAIAATRNVSTATGSSPVAQDELLRMLAEASLERRLTPRETWALNRAHRQANETATARGRVPVLRDVITALYTPRHDDVPGPRVGGTAHLSTCGVVRDHDIAAWGLDVALTLERFVDEGAYAGYFDAETAGPISDRHPHGEPVDLNAALLVIDTSEIPSNSLILSVVMAVTASFLAARWSQMPGYKMLVIEEAYSADGLGAVPAVFRDLAKRSRGIGMGLVAVFHHMTDVTRESPMYSLMREAEIVHIFRQDRDDDAAEVVGMYGLPEDLMRTIRVLPKGVFVYLRGRLPATVVRPFRTEFEAWVSDTDEAMRGDWKGQPTELATDTELAGAVRVLQSEAPTSPTDTDESS